jgi:hypothetical protein
MRDARQPLARAGQVRALVESSTPDPSSRLRGGQLPQCLASEIRRRANWTVGVGRGRLPAGRTATTCLGVARAPFRAADDDRRTAPADPSHHPPRL